MAHLTVLEASYELADGVVSVAGPRYPERHPVNDVCFTARPAELYSPAQLGLVTGTLMSCRPPRPHRNLVAPLASYAGWTPIDPSCWRLSSQAGFDPGGIWRDGVYAYGDYPRCFLDAAGNRSCGCPAAGLAASPPAGCPATRWARRCSADSGWRHAGSAGPALRRDVDAVADSVAAGSEPCDGDWVRIGGATDLSPARRGRWRKRKVAELGGPLRAKPPLEDAKDQYRAAATQLANAITALVLDLTWRTSYGHLDRLRWWYEWTRAKRRIS